MSIQITTLNKRLLLSCIPGLYLSLIVIAVMTFDETPLVQQLISGAYFLDLMWSIYFALFGIFIQVPFITQTTNRRWRIAALTGLAIITAFPAMFMAGLIDEYWSSTAIENYLAIAAAFIALGLLLLISLSVFAPLALTIRLAVGVAATSLVAGILMVWFINNFLCIIFCNEWTNVLLAVPIIISPVLYCLAIHFGQAHSPVDDE